MDGVNKFLEDPLLSYKYLSPEYLFDRMRSFVEWFYHLFFQEGTLSGFKVILSLLSIFFLFVIAYTSTRMLEIRRKEKEHLAHEIAEYARHQEAKQREKIGEEVSKNENWRNVLAHLVSPNLNDWKLAILEADTMLEGLLTQLGFEGENIGEKLKLLDKEKFRNLNFAWEAHSMRNRIAHEGIDFTFSHAEANRIITLYEQIFRDYDYI